MRFGGKRIQSQDVMNLGPGYSRGDILEAIKIFEGRLLDTGCSIETENSLKTLVQMSVIELAMGNAVGWFQGRSDFAPRSFGKRSVLYDPRRSDFEAVLSQKINHIDNLNLFGVSILADDAGNWFDVAKGGDRPQHYARAFESKLPLLPFVSNSNGMAVVHLVEKPRDGIFYMLLKKFNKKTMVPFLLDVPLKLNDVVVLSPVDAIETFLKTQLDVLVLGDVILRRNRKAPVRLPIEGSSDIDVFVR